MEDLRQRVGLMAMHSQGAFSRKITITPAMRQIMNSPATQPGFANLMQQALVNRLRKITVNLTVSQGPVPMFTPTNQGMAVLGSLDNLYASPVVYEQTAFRALRALATQNMAWVLRSGVSLQGTVEYTLKAAELLGALPDAAQLPEKRQNLEKLGQGYEINPDATIPNLIANTDQTTNEMFGNKLEQLVPASEFRLTQLAF